MGRPKKSEVIEPQKDNILNCFDFISQSDKNKFLKKAESLKVSQEDLLNVAILGLLDGYIPFEIETITKLSLPKREKKAETD